MPTDPTIQGSIARHLPELCAHLLGDAGAAGDAQAVGCLDIITRVRGNGSVTVSVRARRVSARFLPRINWLTTASFELQPVAELGHLTYRSTPIEYASAAL